MSTSSQKTTPRQITVSSSSWWLTFCQETKDVFIWKGGQRLKIGDGTSAGQTKSVAVTEATSGSLLVSVFELLILQAIVN